MAGDHVWSSFPASDYDYIVCSSVEVLPKWISGYPRHKKVFVAHENPLIWKPSREELSQFGVIIAPWSSMKDVLTDQLFIQAHSAVPWFYGIEFRTDTGLLHHPLRTSKELDYLEAFIPAAKTKLASCIVSGKGCLEGHKWRVAVAEALANHYPGMVDIYGFGHKPLPDKALALDDYQFSIIIENTPSKYYWTEKLSDCILGRAIPIYAGAANAQEDLKLSFPVIAFGEDPEKTARAIVKATFDCLIDSASIEACRKRILFQHNFMHWIPCLLQSHVA